MVWFVPDATREELIHCALQAMPQGAIFAPMIATYRVEAVSDYDSLSECAQILHAGYDERAVALMKAFCLAEYSDAHQGRADMTMIFRASEDTGECQLFTLDGDDMISLTFDEALYAECQVLVGDEKPTVVDDVWATAHLQKLMAKSH